MTAPIAQEPLYRLHRGRHGRFLVDAVVSLPGHLEHPWLGSYDFENRFTNIAIVNNRAAAYAVFRLFGVTKYQDWTRAGNRGWEEASNG